MYLTDSNHLELQTWCLISKHVLLKFIVRRRTSISYRRVELQSNCTVNDHPSDTNWSQFT